LDSPHYLWLSVNYNCHINVEVCVSMKSEFNKFTRAHAHRSQKNQWAIPSRYQHKAWNSHKWCPKHGRNLILIQCISSSKGAWCLFHFQLHQKFLNIGCLTMQLPKVNHLKFSLLYDATPFWLQGQMITLAWRFVMISLVM
jgi:hypothetical protein